MDDYFDDMVDGGDDMEEMVTLMDSARPLKRSRSGDGADGDEMDDADAAGAGCEVWQRPPLPDINTETDTLLFQWMSIDVCGGEPLKANPRWKRYTTKKRDDSIRCRFAPFSTI